MQALLPSARGILRLAGHIARAQDGEWGSGGGAEGRRGVGERSTPGADSGYDTVDEVLVDDVVDAGVTAIGNVVVALECHEHS
jgi:hypothetical protein